jgi:hypothetical protein
VRQGFFFEKKRRKKPLLLVPIAAPMPQPAVPKVFCFFFQKRSAVFNPVLKQSDS